MSVFFFDLLKNVIDWQALNWDFLLLFLSRSCFFGSGGPLSFVLRSEGGLANVKFSFFKFFQAILSDFEKVFGHIEDEDGFDL